MLAFYDSEQELFNEDPLRTVHNGKPGGSDVVLFYIRNDDVATYYENIVVSIISADDDGPYSSSGWSAKVLSGSREPTEAEWDSVSTLTSLSLDDIGDTDAADTATYFPIWYRVYCPGDSLAQIRETQTIRLTFEEKLVGA